MVRHTKESVIFDREACGDGEVSSFIIVTVGGLLFWAETDWKKSASKKISKVWLDRYKTFMRSYLCPQMRENVVHTVKFDVCILIIILASTRCQPNAKIRSSNTIDVSGMAGDDLGNFTGKCWVNGWCLGEWGWSESSIAWSHCWPKRYDPCHWFNPRVEFRMLNVYGTESTTSWQPLSESYQ